jgi:hypothetical protein
MEHDENSDLVPRQSNEIQLNDFENSLLNILRSVNLPTNSVFIPIQQRRIVFKMISDVLADVSPEQRLRSIYLSKFVAAVAAGLFDAALNYLWDETIYELRKRVAQYDISYFFENAVKNTEKRVRLKSVEDLDQIDDQDLIKGAQSIELISELGYRQLDTIRYMRNWASAAHPNQNEITGINLISWLHVCIKEVISLPLSNSAAEIRQLLVSIKSISFDEKDAKDTAMVSLQFTSGQINRLVAGLSGLYVTKDTSPQTQRNIRLLLPFLWDRVDEENRVQLGAKYNKYAAVGEQDKKKLTQEFLEIVSATSYLPEGARIVAIDDALDNLLSAHYNLNNFYNEPQFARALKDSVGDNGKVPSKINRKYVLTLVEVFLTNGNGVALSADPIYSSLIKLFDPDQSLIAVLAFREDTISSKLQFRLCQEKYRELLDMLKLNIALLAVKELIDSIEKFNGPLGKLKDDARISSNVENLLKIIS